VLFLNRRGMATHVFCRDCGYVARCPHCDQPLTYHEGSVLHCHSCGRTSPSPELCPQCGSRRIRYFGSGTQNVEAEVQKRFPSARVLRWDSDIAHTPEMGDALLARFIDRQADILVGTELVTKGLDLPLVTLVGVVSADTALNLPDFHAAERGFQVLMQAIARTGRGLLPGQVIVQSHMPEHPAVASACAMDVDGFAAYELAQRLALGYPPYRRLARIEFKHSNAARARDMAVQAANALRRRITDLGYTGSDLIGPAPCFHERVNNTFRWQVLVRSPDPHSLLREVAAAQGWHVELDPVDVL
jgi:primosomal protein N' (replication factor Y)